MLLQLSQFFSLCPSLPGTPIPSSNPPICSCPWVVLWLHISYTVLNTPLPILYLPFMLLNPCTFSSVLPLPPPSDLCIYDSVPVLVVCYLNDIKISVSNLNIHICIAF